MPKITFVRGRSKSSQNVKHKPKYRWIEDSPPQIKPVFSVVPRPVKDEVDLNPIKELESLIGLKKVKEIISEITAYAKIQKMRQVHSLKNEPLVLHMIFKGNPGTGKTTVARILGRLFQQINILPKGHLVEIERADLVGEYIGHTAQKTRIQVNKALGGILFIDEAYSLARGGDKDFGKEAIDTLVKATEDHKNELIVILAGYKKEMDLFMLSNPGLKSRFPIQITFPDYKKDELMRIADQMAHDREYTLSTDAKGYLHDFLNQFNASTLNFSNARLVRNLIERAIRKQASRLVKAEQPTRNQLMTLEKGDFIGEDLEEIEDKFYYI